MFSIKEQFDTVAHMIGNCAVDVRDEWPTNADNYAKTESIARGTFGIVRLAKAYDPIFGLDGLDNRTCVVKTVYLQRRFESMLCGQRVEADENSGNGDRSSRLFRFYRRTMMELFVLSRCRHANIMHLHAVFISDGDLHIVLPRLYVLERLIQLYKRRKQSEPIPVAIIAKILRQLCLALDFLQRIGIVHRDVQPENIFLTRGGTVKLGHFAQARALFEATEEPELRCCKTPVGREEFMCFEKQHNLYSGRSLDECVDYSFSADMWSLGVLVLAMVSYYPEEMGQKLHKNFAMAMHHEQMPFIWLTVDMLQLRSRLVKSGGEELKLFLSDHLLTVSAGQRATAASLLCTPEMKKWCLPSVEEDSTFVRKYLIDEVDFANHQKLENDLPNYDALETKDIPAEFYWDDTWLQLEEMELSVQLFITTEEKNYVSKVHCFRFADAEPFFRILYAEVVASRLELTDLLTVDSEIKQAIFELAKRKYSENRELKPKLFTRRHCELPHSRSIDIELRPAPPKWNNRLRMCSESPSACLTTAS